jgi:penicillin-binding protein 1A
VVEGALVAIDAASGEVRALVGGFDFRRSEFDRATRRGARPARPSSRSCTPRGSCAGLTLSDRVLDAPTVFVEPGP